MIDMYKLTEEGHEYLKNGLPEKVLLKTIDPEKALKEVSALPKSQIAIGWARKNGWVVVENNVVKVTDLGRDMIRKKTDVENALDKINNKKEIDEEYVKLLLRRNLIFESKEKKEKKKRESFIKRIFKGKKKEEKIISTEIAQLTPDLILSGEWKNRVFKSYDINAPAPKLNPGKIQPYVQFIEDLKERLIGLGFQEMRGGYVQTSFWNCDALFIPQDHPAKGLHDIFYMKKPKVGVLPNDDLVSKVKATHEGGWITESAGWGGDWSSEESKKLVMRSHTTAISARTLVEHGDKPGKYFIIDRNFRPDQIDASHLMEFDQCEGIVIGENLTLRHLLGFLQDIGETIGAKEVKFKPGFFPYTEPSVEGFIKHPKLGWIEVFAAGMFRPEMLRPLGIEKSQVLAWGIGIGRLAMHKLGISDIRMLYSDNLGWLRKTPLVI